MICGWRGSVKALLLQHRMGLVMMILVELHALDSEVNRGSKYLLSLGENVNKVLTSQDSFMRPLLAVKMQPNGRDTRTDCGVDCM